jgi:hypothetical protein
MMGFGYGMAGWGGFGWLGSLLFLALVVLDLVPMDYGADMPHGLVLTRRAPPTRTWPGP